MSGILCVYSESGIRQDLPRYLAALRRLSHRGPHGEGHRLLPGLFLGARRSTVGLGSSGEQPVASPDESVVVALDGHVHNREELAHVLRARGTRADLSSDAALVLELYREFGEQFVERLRGVWALVVWDARSHRLLIARDPLGVRPLYHYRATPHLIIASEIKSVIQLDDDARATDQPRVRALIHDGLIDDWTGTCFAHIRPVPPGTVLTFHEDQLTTNRYWSLRPSTDRTLSPADIREKLVAAVERHTPTGVKVGLALSGGIDSSSIAGILARSSPGGARNLHAFSITPPHTIDESSLIEATVRHTGIPHTHVPVEPLDYPRALDRLLDFHDEPVHYSGAFYQFVLRQRMAEAGCQAALVGYGADEIFGGYRELAPVFLVALAVAGRLPDSVRFVLGARDFLQAPGRRLVAEALRYARVRARAAVIRALKRTMAYEVYRRRAAHRAHPPDAPGPPVPLDTEAGPYPSPHRDEYDLHGVDRGRIFFEALLRSFRRNIPLLVRQEDRNAMAHGLDLCAPFMDEDLVRAALAFPFHRYMEGGQNKAVLRTATRDLLAAEVIAEPRKLFTPGSDPYVAFEVLRPQLLDLLSSPSFHGSGLWSRGCLESYQADSARRARGHLWFRIFMVHRWYERVVRAAADGPATR
ncbi:MAG TPA: asparagine synthase-related protein [Candidatus Nitrosotalea sp.]|nr:asparagine synthase-related protein [Candidatus Nitrosotalea sp.]